MMMSNKSGWVIGLCLAAWCAAAQADPVAYWRHEEGSPGALIPAGPDTVLDSTGNSNHMKTFDPAFTSADYSSSVSPLALRSGDPNTLSLNFGPGGVDEDRFRGGRDDDNFTDGKPINGHLFREMTVELAFNMHTVDGWQALVGKDGKPTDHLSPPFKVLIRNDDFPGGIPHQLFIEWIDGDGDLHFLASRQTTTTDTWNHAAFVLTPTEAQLWIAGETTPYTLLDSIAGDFAGGSGEVLFNSEASWTVGRGMFNGGIADWADALIDEVRIADMALTPDQFLFAAIPEPSALALSLLALAGWSCRRSRR